MSDVLSMWGKSGLLDGLTTDKKRELANVLEKTAHYLFKGA